jgi:hypothetical protein
MYQAGNPFEFFVPSRLRVKPFRGDRPAAEVKSVYPVLTYFLQNSARIRIDFPV